MNIAAGVFLIIAAVFNLFAGLGYVAGGGMTTGAAHFSSKMAQEMVKNNPDMTAEERQAAQNFNDSRDTSGVNLVGSGFLLFGIFLLVSVGILIAGAVCLFQNKKPKFIFVAGGMAILAEIMGIMIMTFGILNLAGIIGGVFALIAGIQINKAGDETAE